MIERDPVMHVLEKLSTRGSARGAEVVFREAQAAAAGSVPIEEPRARAVDRLRPWMFAVTVPLVVAALVAVAVVTTSDHSRGRVDTGGVTHPTGQDLGQGALGVSRGDLAAVTTGGDLVIIDGHSGAVVRRLASDVAVQRNLPRVAATPDGQTVYFDHGRASTPGECVQLNGSDLSGLGIDEIASVPVNGGAVASVSRGTSPALSPDGQFLAFVRSRGCYGDYDLVVRNLATGYERTFDTTAAGNGLGAQRPYWAPNSRHLAFVLDIGSTFPWMIDTTTATTIGDATRLEQSDGLGWFGFYGTNGELLGIHQPAPTDSSSRTVVAFSPVTGVATRTLFAIPTNTPADLTAIPNGTEVIFADPSASDQGLWRWREGETTATKLSDVPAMVITRIGP